MYSIGPLVSAVNDTVAAVQLYRKIVVSKVTVMVLHSCGTGKVG